MKLSNFQNVQTYGFGKMKKNKIKRRSKSGSDWIASGPYPKAPSSLPNLGGPKKCSCSKCVRLDVISTSLNVVYFHSSPSLVGTTPPSFMSLFAITYCCHSSPSPIATIFHHHLMSFFAINYCCHFSPLLSATIHHYLLLIFKLIHAWVSKKRKKKFRIFVGLFFCK
jgi:hypothetical protein